MGRNNKRNKAITKMYLKPLQKYCQQLEQQLEALKTDPNTTLGQVIVQAREMYTQNSRLSVLCAALLEAAGDKVTIKKSKMDKFENHRVVIKWELPEGFTGKPEESEEFVFTFEAVKNPDPNQPQVQVVPAAEGQEQIVTPVITQQSVEGVGIQGVDADNQELIITEGTATACAGGPSCLHGDKANEGCDTADESDEVVSTAMQGVDCPYCEDNTEHTHSMEEIEELQGDPLPECDVHTRTGQ